MGDALSSLLILSFPTRGSTVYGAFVSQVARWKIEAGIELVFAAEPESQDQTGGAGRKMALRFSSRAKLDAFLAEFRSGCAEGVRFEVMAEVATPELDALSVLI